MKTNAERKELHGRLSGAVSLLMEHFDAIQIFGVLHDGEADATYTFEFGQGNACARREVVRDWLTTGEERRATRARMEEVAEMQAEDAGGREEEDES